MQHPNPVTASIRSVVTPLVGETIYSVCARTHLFWGEADATRTSELLLGHGQGPVHHDIPFGLEQLASASNCAIESSESCLRERTVLAVYLPFMSVEQRQRVVRACASNSGGPLSTVRAHRSWQIARVHELRFCPACFEEDRRQHGFSYWRNAHQLPGCWVCLRHQLALHYRSARRKGATWLTVDDAEESSAPPCLASQDLHFLSKVTSCITWLSTLSIAEPQVLCAMVRLRLHEGGYLRRELKRSHGEFERITEQVTLPLAKAGIPGFQGLATPTWIRETLIDRRSTHPLRWATLLAVAGDVSSDQLQESWIEASDRLPDLELFQDMPRRRTRAPKTVYQALSGPVTLARAANDLGVEVPELQRWLKRDPELGKHWKRSAIDVKAGAAKFAIQGFLREHPGATRMEVLNSCRWAVRFLEQVEPGFLGSVLPISQTTAWRQMMLFP